MARKPSVSRRKSVLSEQYKPEDDEDEDEDEETEDLQNAPSSRRKQPSPITIPRLSGARDTAEPDFLSGVFSVPLEQMGEPPLKMKTSLRRAVSHSAPETSKNDIHLCYPTEVRFHAGPFMSLTAFISFLYYSPLFSPTR